MNYEIEEVLRIIRKELKPGTVLLSQNVQATLEATTRSVVQLVETETRALKKNLMANHSNQLTGCIPLYESDIIKAWDTVHGYLQADPLLPGAGGSRRSLKKNYDKIKNALRGLLWFIHEYFGRYRNLHQKIPNEVAQDFRLKLLPAIGTYREKLADAGTEDWLCGHVLKPLTGFVDSRKTVNYRQLQYLEGYILSTDRLLNAATPGRQALYQHLLLEGYNDAGFCDSVINGYLDTMLQLPGIADRLNYLHETLKQLRQLHAAPQRSYDDRRGDVHELLAHWLEEEIRFTGRETRSQPLPIPPTAAPRDSIQLQLSVYELALGARLLMEAKLISEDSFPKVAKYLTANFRTHKKENLSPESFRKKSYEFERSVVNKVKDKIILLMNLVQHF